jgi:hypothetical protein
MDRATCYELISLPDLVLAKKTQRDKDWLMLQQLLEVHYLQHRGRPHREHILFWLRESRDAERVRSLVRKYPRLARLAARHRPLLFQAAEREMDRIYWRPLRRVMEKLRHRRVGSR